MLHFRVTLILVVCVVLYIAETTAQKSDAPGQKGIVHGYIVDTTPAQLPITGVRVQIDNEKGRIFETTSAETGEFIYRDIPAGDYLINIHKSGYQSRIGKPVSVTNGGVHYVPLTMNKKENIFTGLQNWLSSKEPKGGTLQLQVTTPSPQSDPIENAGIEIRDIALIAERVKRDPNLIADIEVTGTSDADGQYRHDNLPSGLYFVTVSKDSYHTTIWMTVRENRMTTAAVKLPISNGILPSQETDTKWVIRGKIFETDFQQTPISSVKVNISDRNLKYPKNALSNADGEYEFVLLPGRYSISLYKNGYEDARGFLEVTAANRQSSVTVIKEGMFVVYEAVANENVLTLKHGLSKEQKSFSEKYGETIQEALFTTIMSGILGFLLSRFSRFLNKRRRKYKILWDLRTDRHKQFLNKRRRKYNQE
ncbi:carboxypeptidase regulatory-like domain-containing protein [Candidatus Poribacteria bacterium]|nr:carboxypeptidase regulatory-like domain-containing protein [Candidatus Poribacteria bacterium]